MAKEKPISVSVNSLISKSKELIPHLQKLVQAHDPALQILPKFEYTTKAINLISTFATGAHKPDFFPRRENN